MAKREQLLYVASEWQYRTGVAAFRISPHGELTALSPFFTAWWKGARGLTADVSGNGLILYGSYPSCVGFVIGPHGHLTNQYMPSRTNAFVARHPNKPFAYRVGAQGIYQYRLTTNGKMVPLSPAVAPLTNGVQSIAVDPQGRALYGTGTGVRQYKINPKGTLEPFRPFLVDNLNIDTLEITAHPSGRYVYVQTSHERNVSKLAVLRDGRLGQETGVLPKASDNLFLFGDLVFDNSGKFAFAIENPHPGGENPNDLPIVRNIVSRFMVLPNGILHRANPPSIDSQRFDINPTALLVHSL